MADWIPARDNLNQIKVVGLRSWLREQIERQAWLEELLQHYNEGRSMSLYCKVCSRISIDLIKKAIIDANENISNKRIDAADMKAKARVFKAVIKDLAATVKVQLD